MGFPSCTESRWVIGGRKLPAKREKKKEGRIAGRTNTPERKADLGREMRDHTPFAVFAVGTLVTLAWIQHTHRITPSEEQSRISHLPSWAEIGIQSGPTPPLNFEIRQFKDVSGPGFRIYRPGLQGVRCNTRDANQQIFGHPESWKLMLMSRLEILDDITTGSSKMESAFARSSMAYAEMLKSFVSGAGFGKAEKTVHPGRPPYSLSPFSAGLREGGTDWPYLGVTMTGRERLRNVQDLLNAVFLEKIPGDYIETGVWRGGSSIFARGMMRFNGEGHRLSFVCDIFRGLPPGDRKLDRRDRGWDSMTYLQVGDDLVANHFCNAGIMDPNVVFAKGFFNDTMVPLKSAIKELAIIRLDGDMYESTVDVLYNLYDKLSMGGYAIMDDWDMTRRAPFPSKTAVLDFFKCHGLQEQIIKIDQLSAYWKKTQHVDIQYWRYKQLDFKCGKTASVGTTRPSESFTAASDEPDLAKDRLHQM